MGQKVNPVGMRVGINKDWDATWFASKKDFADFLIEDHKIREFLNKKYSQCGISKITIERTAKKVIVHIFTGKPGMLIGQKGAGVELLKADLSKLVKTAETVLVDIKEIKRIDLDSKLVAESIAQQLEKRVSFKRALKGALQRVMKAGAKGCKVQVSGVVDGANTIARTEYYMEGNLPLSTLRADIDYATASAFTNYGKLGVKVWIYKGEILGQKKEVKGGQD
ncbi:MAG: 30S ribosomal protein S3 [Clostridia bacterium]|nr:30S ribosomal protein S3 [Clostridia bacterium]MBR2220865.1 30S ribosomal protein S3 [Clostridia bacterium]MBR2433492.1 30S ribosomal protein S3 [Clostridia bacterium]